MPYNLRKRKTVEPVEIKKEPAVKRSRNGPKQPKEPAKKRRKDETFQVETKPEPKEVAVEKKEVKQQQVKQDKIKEQPVRCNQLVFGADTCGELGFKKIGILKKLPTSVHIDEPIKQVCCGPMHTVSLTQSGKVYTYGCNDEGALGRITDGDETVEATPTIVPINGKVVKVSAGDSHTAALTENNEVFIWGNFRDEHGSIGLTPECDGQASYNPIQLLPKTEFQDIASGSNHMLLLDVNGVVYSFGVGAQGQLGRLKPEDIGESEKAHAINAENRELFLTPQPVCLKNVDPQRPFVCDAIYAGNFSSFATNTDKKKNRLAGWGLNNYHQLGYKGLKDQLVQYFPRRSTFTCSTSMVGVACGQHHTLFLTKTGRVYAAGRDQYGMLGLGKVGKDLCPPKFIEALGNSVVCISAGINTSFAVDNEGKLFSWGMSGSNLGVESEDDLHVPTEVKSLDGKKVVSVSTGGSFTAVIVA